VLKSARTRKCIIPAKVGSRGPEPHGSRAFLASGVDR